MLAAPLLRVEGSCDYRKPVPAPLHRVQVRFEKNGGEDDDQDILHNASNNEGHAARMLHDSCSTDIEKDGQCAIGAQDDPVLPGTVQDLWPVPGADVEECGCQWYER